MNLIELHINGISYSQTENGAYALILSESEGERKLPIVIGTNEAQSIAIAIEKEIKTKELLNNLGIAYLATKQNDKSKAMFEAALQIDPEYKPAKDNLENIKNIN